MRAVQNLVLPWVVAGFLAAPAGVAGADVAGRGASIASGADVAGRGASIVSAAGAAMFVEATARLGSPQPCADANEGCNSHYVVLVDLDGDVDLDIVFANGGGYYEPGSSAPLAVYLNDGQASFIEVNDERFDAFEGRIWQVAVGDVDDDGDVDLYLADSYGLQPDAFFINDGESPPHFTDEGAIRLPLSSRSAGSRFADVDSDGDLDLVLTDWGDDPPASPGTARIYLNDGAGMFREKSGAVPQNTSSIGTGPVDIDLFDADRDFDLDLVIGSREGDSLLFFNNGDGSFRDGNAQLPAQGGPYVYGPDPCDVDGDGDLDLWMPTGSAGLRLQLLINDGKGTFSDETRNRIRTGSNLSADDDEVQCLDLDLDGDFDAVVASLSANERILINDGRGNFSLETGAFPKVQDSTLGLDLGDLNGDGLIDAATAQGESGVYLNRLYLGISPQVRDTRAPVLRMVEQPVNGVAAGRVPVRFAVSDRATTDIGPRLRRAWLQLADGTTVTARFMGGDLFRGVLDVAPGATVRYRACATDAAGNQACSAEKSFTAGS